MPRPRCHGLEQPPQREARFWRGGDSGWTQVKRCLLELAAADRTVRSITAAQGGSVMSLSPPNPAVSHLFRCIISPGILLLPITGFSGITRAKPQIILMTTTDQVRMLLPSEAVTAGDPPTPLNCCQEGPRTEGAPGHHVPCTLFGSPSPWDVWGSQDSPDVPVKYWFYWVGVPMAGCLCR